MTLFDGETPASGFNGDKLRLEEHAKILGSVSNFVELLEDRDTSIESTNTVSFDVFNDGTTAVPSEVTAAIGAVKTIDVHLSLNQELVDTDTPYFEPTVEPSDEALLARIGTQPAATEELSPVANISLYLHSDIGFFAISRSSLKSAAPVSDAAFIHGEPDPTFTAPVSQAKVNALILSLLEPTPLEDRQPSRDVDFLKPQAFGILQDLFQDASTENENSLGYAFQTSDAHFKYVRSFDEIQQLYKTSFDIRYRTPGEFGRVIFAHNSMGTKFTTSFETLDSDVPYRPDASVRHLLEYKPTLEELAYLVKIIDDEYEYTLAKTNGSHQSIDVAVNVAEDDSQDLLALDDAITEELAVRELKVDMKIQDAVNRLIDE